MISIKLSQKQRRLTKESPTERNLNPLRDIDSRNNIKTYPSQSVDPEGQIQSHPQK